jgi:hypothetical protein
VTRRWVISSFAVASSLAGVLAFAQDKRPTKLELRYPANQRLAWDMSLSYRSRAEAHETFRMDQRAKVQETVIATPERDPIRVRWERLSFAARFFDGKKTFAYEDDGKDAADKKADFAAIAALAGPVERSYEYELARGTLAGGKVDHFAWLFDVKPKELGAWAEGVRVVQERGAQRFQGRPLEKGSSWTVAEDDEDVRFGWTLKKTTTYTVVAREVFDGRACVRLETTQQGRLEGRGDLCEITTCAARGEALFDLELGNVAREQLRSDVVLKRRGGSPAHVFEDERTLDFRLLLLPREEAKKPDAPKTDKKDSEGD